VLVMTKWARVLFLLLVVVQRLLLLLGLRRMLCTVLLYLELCVADLSRETNRLKPGHCVLQLPKSIAPVFTLCMVQTHAPKL